MQLVTVVFFVALALGAARAEGDCKEGEDWARCPGASCIPKSKFCDGEGTCPDYADEKNCTKCILFSIPCDGRCAHWTHRCDGVVWCRDGADERNCTAAQKRSPLCSQGSRCNGLSDCKHWDEEEFCEPEDCQAPATARTYCDGRCIPANKWCNNEENCEDGKDESNCSPDDCQPPSSKETYCDGRCFRTSDWCDGFAHCKDGKDELNCTSCQEGSLLCDGSRCVWDEHRCDGVAWCRDGADERNCTEIKKEPACNLSSRCNGIRGDCDSWDEEKYCEPDDCRAPAAPHTYCDGQCMPADKWCDGKQDCKDGKDEANCPRG